MILEEMLGSFLTVRSFVDDYLFKLPLALAGGCRKLLDLGSWEVMAHLLQRPEVDIVVGNTRGERSHQRPATCAEAQQLLALGYTVGVRHAQQHHPDLAQLAARFHNEFFAPVDIHLYATSSGTTGLGWHYDAEDVFILQTLGSKQWSLRKNTVNPWPIIETLPDDMHYEKEIMPLLRCTLAAGDWLYMPGGYWHRTRAIEESLSLSVGVASPTGVDVFDFLRSQVLESLRWRERLPVRGACGPHDDALLAKNYQAIFRALGEDLAHRMCQPNFVRAFLAPRATSDRQDTMNQVRLSE